MIRWNQGSPHDRIDGVVWDGAPHRSWVDGKRVLEITEYDVVAAAHFVRNEMYSVNWMTEFILDTEKKESV